MAAMTIRRQVPAYHTQREPASTGLQIAAHALEQFLRLASNLLAFPPPCPARVL